MGIGWYERERREENKETCCGQRNFKVGRLNIYSFFVEQRKLHTEEAGCFTFYILFYSFSFLSLFFSLLFVCFKFQDIYAKYI